MKKKCIAQAETSVCLTRTESHASSQNGTICQDLQVRRDAPTACLKKYVLLVRVCGCAQLTQRITQRSQRARGGEKARVTAVDGDGA